MPKKPGNLTQFATMLRKLRASSGMTQAEAAEAIGIARSTLATYESGKDVPGRDNLAAIAVYYKIGLSDLWPAGAAARGQPRVPQFIDDPDELALINLWRSLNEGERAMLLRMMSPSSAAAA